MKISGDPKKNSNKFEITKSAYHPVLLTDILVLTYDEHNQCPSRAKGAGGDLRMLRKCGILVRLWARTS